MATQNRPPTGDSTVTGTVSGSAGTRYTLVDDYPDASTSDMLTFGTAVSHINFTFSAFTVPAGSTGLSVQVRYVDGEAANGANNSGSRLVINGSNFNATTHNPSGTTGTAREDNWATNPSSGAAWTVDEVNGIGTHGIDGFGTHSTDCNPTYNVRSIEIQVTYTPPPADILLAAVLDGDSTTAGIVQLPKLLASVAAGDSTVATALQLAKLLSATAAADTSLVGALTVGAGEITLTASLDADSTATGAVSLAKLLATLLAAEATAASSLRNDKLFSASLNAESTLTADLTISTPVRLAATLGVMTGLAASLKYKHAGGCTHWSSMSGLTRSTVLGRPQRGTGRFARDRSK